VAPVLRYADFNKPFVIMVDASDLGISGVLMQRDEAAKALGVVEYYSRVYTPPEKNYGIPQRELLALQVAVTHWRRYLFGSDFVVWTDQESIVGTIGNVGHRREMEPGVAARLVTKLSPYLPYMTVRWLAGKRNVIADALTRAPFVAEGTLSSLQAGDIGHQRTRSVASLISAAADDEKGEGGADGEPSAEVLRKLQAADPEVVEMIEFVKKDGKAASSDRAALLGKLAGHLALHKGVQYFTAYPRTKGTRDEATYQLVVPRGELRERLLKQYHDGGLAGHLGSRKTLARLQDKYWWLQMGSDVVSWCSECITCQHCSAPRTTYADMIPIKETRRFYTWVIDHVDFPESDAGNKHALVMVDVATCAVELWPTKSTGAEEAAIGVLECIVTRYGAPGVLASDRGAAFTSSLFSELCTRMGCTSRFSTAHHPQSHGKVERTIRTVEEILRKYVSKHQRDWDRFLCVARAAINGTPSATTGIAPFKLVTGENMRLPIDNELVPRDGINDSGLLGAPAELAKMVTDRTEELRQLAVQNAEQSQQTQKKDHDKLHKKPGPELGVGRYVECKKVTQDLPSTMVKLTQPYDGPYLVVDAPSPVNWRIREVRSGNELVVHVERLKPFVGAPELLEKGHYEVKEILEERTSKDGKVLYRVRWKGFGKRYDSWEKADNFPQDSEPLRRFKMRPEAERRQPADKKRVKATTQAMPKTAAPTPPVQLKKTNTKADEKAKKTPPGTPKKEPVNEVTRSGRRRNPNWRDRDGFAWG
jgi:transposase InsO family protein